MASGSHFLRSSMARLSNSFIGLLFLMTFQPFDVDEVMDFAGNHDDQGMLEAPADYEEGSNICENRGSTGEGHGNGNGNGKGKGKGKAKEEDDDHMDIDEDDHHQGRTDDANSDDDDNGGGNDDFRGDDCEDDESSTDDGSDDSDFVLCDYLSDVEAEMEAARRRDSQSQPPPG